MSDFNDNFNSLSKDKIEFAKRIINDEQLAKCLLSNERNFLDIDIDEENRDKLIWEQVFPYRFVPSVDQKAQSYITMAFKYNRQSIWKLGTITFYLFCHKNIVRTDYGVLRYDFMLQRLNEIVNDTRFDTWLGKVQLIDMDEINIDDKGNFIGLMVRYKITEFM